MTRSIKATPAARRPRLGLEALEAREVPAIDLSGYETFAPDGNLGWGQSIDVQCQNRNTGSTASGSFKVAWYLSKDSTGSSDDILLKRTNGTSYRTHSSIAGNGFGADYTVTLVLPTTKPSGWTGTSFHLITKTDSANQVAESNENNNFGQKGLNKDRDTVTAITAGSFTSFSTADASQDDSPNTVFRDGAVRFSYAAAPASGFTLDSVTLEAVKNSTVTTVATTTGATGAGVLGNLYGLADVTSGNYQFRVRATMTNGAVVYSSALTRQVLDGPREEWTFAGETIPYTSTSTLKGAAYAGAGGTDTLDLGVYKSAVASIDGVSLADFDPTDWNEDIGQAIYHGSLYDYIRLTNGREVYFQGVERLQFLDGVVELTVAGNDPQYASQWNLHAQDVPGAWRFHAGSEQVLIVSLDTGLPLFYSEGVNDLPTDGRLIDQFADGDQQAGDGHGHMSISVMAAVGDNGYGITPINFASPVLVTNVYTHSPVNAQMTLQAAIQLGLDYARDHAMKVVFQGGIQGEAWLNDGGNQAALEALMADNEDIGLFAVAAGNAGQDIDITNVKTDKSGGVARLEATHPNVMAIGALERTETTKNGLANASAVNRASYSNFGNKLTLVGATDVPAMTRQGTVKAKFNGTSAANPNVAAIASLVWGEHPYLTGPQVRQILTDTAMDLGAEGRDAEYGYGLVNAEAAVRRAYALWRDAELAGLFGGDAGGGGASVPPSDGGSPAGGPEVPVPPSAGAESVAVAPAAAPESVAATVPAAPASVASAVPAAARHAAEPVIALFGVEVDGHRPAAVAAAAPPARKGPAFAPPAAEVVADRPRADARPGWAAPAATAGGLWAGIDLLEIDRTAAV